MKRSKEYVARLKEENRKQVETLVERRGLSSELNLWTTLLMNAMIVTMGVKAEDLVMRRLSEIALRGATAPERTKNVGIGISYGQNLSFKTQMPIESMYDPSDGFNLASALILKERNGSFVLQCDYVEGLEMPVQIWQGPSWYPIKVPNQKEPEKPFTLSQLVQRELGVLMLSVPEVDGYQRCDYRQRNEACGFCGMRTQRQPLTPELLVEIVEMDMEENDTSITMTGGNTCDADNGATKYIPFVEALRKRFGEGLPIQLEISPPCDEDYLMWMVDNKLSAWFNVEIFPVDEETERLRRAVMPAKSRIPIEGYYKDFEFLNSRGIETYSVLIAGLQPVEAIVEGAKRLAEIGTTTAVLPFKPNADSEYENKSPCSVEDFLEATIEVDAVLKEKSLDLTKRSKYFCSGCGGCGADRNVAYNREIIY